MFVQTRLHASESAAAYKLLQKIASHVSTVLSLHFVIAPCCATHTVCHRLAGLVARVEFRGFPRAAALVAPLLLSFPDEEVHVPVGVLFSCVVFICFE